MIPSHLLLVTRLPYSLVVDIIESEANCPATIAPKMACPVIASKTCCVATKKQYTTCYVKYLEFLLIYPTIFVFPPPFLVPYGIQWLHLLVSFVTITETISVPGWVRIISVLKQKPSTTNIMVFPAHPCKNKLIFHFLPNAEIHQKFETSIFTLIIICPINESVSATSGIPFVVFPSVMKYITTKFLRGSFWSSINLIVVPRVFWKIILSIITYTKYYLDIFRKGTWILATTIFLYSVSWITFTFSIITISISTTIGNTC